MDSKSTTKFQAAPSSSRRDATVRLQGGFRLEEFLICNNRECRFLVSLRVDNKLFLRADLILSACPECNHPWSANCPFCLQALEVTWQEKVPCCAHCSKPLQPTKRVD
jgi:hypothetical protein